ncbi:MAG: SH3 domain-containing protein [Thermodesulfobacteriota bacterium]
MEDNKKLLEKQLNYITSNFEMDLLRLIKTRSYISMSKEVLNEELNSLKNISLEFQEKLKNLVIKTVQLEGELNESNTFGGMKQRENFKNLNNNLNDYISYTESFVSDIETRKEKSIDKLESLQKYYLVELEASREELDFRIKSLQSSMARMLDSEEGFVKNYSDQITKKHDEIEKKIISKDLGNKPTEKGEFESLLKSTYNGITDEVKKPNESISVVTEINKFRENKKDKWPRIFGAIFFLGIFSLCITVFILYNRDYQKRQLVEESYKQSKIVNQKSDNESPYQNEDQNVKTSLKEKASIIKDNKNDIMKDNAESGLNKINKVDNQDISQSLKYDNNKIVVENKVDSGKTKKTYTLTSNGANLRSGPGTSYDVVGVVKQGEFFESLNESDRHWIKIKMKDNNEGWISGKLIKEVVQ